MRRHITLDFRRAAPPWLLALRMLLLLGGGVALGVVLLQYQQARDQASALAWQKQNLTRLGARQLPDLRPAGGTLSEEQTKRANAILHQLNLPWDNLFRALEKSVDASVSVLSVAPDPAKSTIVIKATAEDMDAAIDFMERLRDSGFLSNVHLLSQQAAEDGSTHLWQVTLAANWETVR